MDGISERLCDRFGQQLVDCVTEFCRDKNIAANNTDSLQSSQPKSAFSEYWVGLKFIQSEPNCSKGQLALTWDLYFDPFPVLNLVEADLNCDCGIIFFSFP